MQDSRQFVIDLNDRESLAVFDARLNFKNEASEVAVFEIELDGVTDLNRRSDGAHHNTPASSLKRARNIDSAR